MKKFPRRISDRGLAPLKKTNVRKSLIFFSGRKLYDKSPSLKTILAFGLVLLISVAALAGMGTVSVWIYKKAITSDFFTTTHIDVAGNARLSRDMVLQYGGINIGDNSLAVSIGEIERNLRNTPWVKEASVKRLLPNRFIIKINERMPSFWIRKDNILYYANEKGDIIAPVESRNFLSLPTLKIMPDAEEMIDCLPRLLSDIRNGILPIETGSISQIVLNSLNEVEIQLEDRDLKLAIAATNWEDNMSNLGVALADLVKRRELAHVREIRANGGNVLIIRQTGGAN